MPLRKDGSYIDFEQVTLGSLVFVEEDHRKDSWFSSECDLKAGEIWMIVTLIDRPRVAILRNLQHGRTTKIRVDDLIELDDKDIVTLGPA